MAAGTKGTISQVIGSTFDAQFPEDALPEIYNAIDINWNQDGEDKTLVGEVQQHLGGGRVRAVALGSTDGLKRGMPITDTGAPVAVPVGEKVLGRVFNLLGDPIDNKPAPEGVSRSPIHREAPEFSAQPAPRSSPPASRSSTSSAPLCEAARSASSAVRASARPSSSRR